MKLLPLVLAALLAPTAVAADSSPIAWEETYAGGAKKAEADGKPLVLKFYTGWCPFCTKMDKTTWIDPKVAKAASSFVMAKVNADVETPAVARYRTTGYPTVIVAGSSGDAVVRMEGYKDAETVAKVLESFVAQRAGLEAALATLKTDKKSVPAQLTIADFHAGAGLHDQAADQYVKVSKSATGPDLVRASAGAGLALTRAGKAKDATKILQKAVEAAGAAPSPALMLALGENARALGNDVQAKTWLDRVVSEHPASPEAAQAKVALGG